MEQTKDVWRLWQCPTCRNELKVNYILKDEHYDRLKVCTCGSELMFIKDLQLFKNQNTEDEN